ncbi:MAG: hypothetical protein ABSD76_04465 [Terriglobales bacterium]|jgi:hypothetical protein
MIRRLSIALLAAAVSVPFATAQMRGGMGRSISSVAHAGFARGIGRHGGTHRFAPGVFPESPFLYSNYDLYYDPNESYAVEDAPPPQIVLMQRASADDSPRKTKSAPLVIEWHGDRYVRFGGTRDADEGATSAHPDYAELPMTMTKPSLSAKRSPTQKERTELPAAQLPPAVLVYPDGHREEISDYAIADGVIYAHGNYWQDGYWTKRIPLSAIDAFATLEANQQRGIRFMLPSAPNVVIASF